MVTLRHPWSLNKEKHLSAAQTHLLEGTSWLEWVVLQRFLLRRSQEPPGHHPLCVYLGVWLEQQPAVGGQPGQRQLGSEGSSHGSLEKHPLPCTTGQSSVWSPEKVHS